VHVLELLQPDGIVEVGIDPSVRDAVALAPVAAVLRDGETIELRLLAQEICCRYRAEFPDEQERYGDAGMAWCLHDNQYILSWAVTQHNGYGGFERQLTWLAGVLDARDFPLDRLARNLDIAADVLSEQNAPGDRALADELSAGARMVRSRPSFHSSPD
jgi:hypothetical protein